jgi:hypothetical protein
MVVEAAVDYLICSDPTCLEPPPPDLVANPPVPPHLAYIQHARMSEFTSEEFIVAQERAIEINQLFAAGSQKQGGFQDASGKNRGRYLGNHGTRNVAATAYGQTGKGCGFSGLGVRPGAARNGAFPDGLNQVCGFGWLH